MFAGLKPIFSALPRVLTRAKEGRRQEFGRKSLNFHGSGDYDYVIGPCKRLSDKENALMAGAEGTTRLLQGCIDRLRAGDSKAGQELLKHAGSRLISLARKTLRGFPNVKRFEQTDDVVQNALMRLWRALERHPPDSVRGFLRLAAAHIRRELIDLARHHYGAKKGGKRLIVGIPDDFEDGLLPYDRSERTNEPSQLAEWTEVHEQIQALPDEEREVFDLLWYQELSEKEAAALLKISVRTLQRRWRSARLKLHKAITKESGRQ